MARGDGLFAGRRGLTAVLGAPSVGPGLDRGLAGRPGPVMGTLDVSLEFLHSHSLAGSVPVYRLCHLPAHRRAGYDGRESECAGTPGLGTTGTPGL